MATTKHTPGPWIVKFPGKIVGHSNKCVVKNDNHFDWVATVQTSNVPEWMENAQLIAAAPDMLEVLESASNFISVYLSKHKGMLGQEWEDAMGAGIQQMNSIIKKAKGL